MINQQRVRRIRNAIYVILILVFFLPCILMIALTVRMTGLANTLNDALEENAVLRSGQVMADDAGAPAGNEETAQLQDELKNDPPRPDTFSEISASGTDQEQSENRTDEPQASGSEQTPTGTAAVPSGQASDDMTAVIERSSDQGSQTPDRTQTDPENTANAQTDSQNGYYAPPSTGAVQEMTVYLTFDNTPSPLTGEILQVLDRHGVKATFFVWGGSGTDPQIYRTITEAGHAIGIHSRSNEDTFSTLYASADYFVSEVLSMQQELLAVTGIKTCIYRLPGGSVTENQERQAVIVEIRDRLQALGFYQFDWTASAQDAVRPALDSSAIIQNLEASVPLADNPVVLMHDGSQSTVQALDDFITTCKQNGYSFGILDENALAVSFLN